MADIQEHRSTLAKYTSSINDAALAKMLKTYALVLNNNDSKHVACTDEKERETVRKNYLQKKLGLSNSDAELEAAIVAVCQTMKEDRLKDRLTFYYLLAEKFGKLGVFA